MTVQNARHHRRPRPDRGGSTRGRSTRRGFTLLELLVVVAIIGILTTLVLAVIPQVRRRAYDAQTRAQMTAIATACQAYFNDFRAYPGPLPNSQVGIAYYPTANYANAPQSSYVYVLDRTNGNAPVPLQLATGVLSATETYATFPNIQQITGAENLVLGLLGGLELKLNANGSIANFAYSDASLFPDGKTPGPLGPLLLSQTTPKRYGSYLQVRTGDLSNSRDSSGNPTMFSDPGGRTANDSPIPEFLDKFANNPMPILYLRANVGGTAVAALGGKDDSGTVLTGMAANGAATYPIAQYDIAGLVQYTANPTMGVAIGINPSNTATNHHGLQALGNASLTDTVASGYASGGANALAILKDPNNPGTANVPNYSVSPPLLGNARQRDAYVLISAGPDGIFGTADDIIYPGG